MFENITLKDDYFDDVISYTNYLKEDEYMMRFFEQHKFTREEKEKQQALVERIEDFFKTINEEYCSNQYYKKVKDSILYFDNLGYIFFTPSRSKDVKTVVEVYSYGITEDEAFLRAVIDIELDITSHELSVNNSKYAKDFKERYPEEAEIIDEDFDSFYMYELAIQDFRKYYGDDLPKVLIDYFENAVNNNMNSNFKYDFETDSFIKTRKLELK